MNPNIHLPPAQLITLDDYLADVQPAEFSLDNDVTTIGRSAICQIVVQRQLVSRLHARIERVEPRYVLHDAGSANGTFVNGRRITEPYILTNRDTIGFGAPAGILRFIDADPTFVPNSQLRYDEGAMRFSLGTQQVELPPSQFKLLLHLYQHPGDVCTRESCAQAIWGRDYDPGMDADALDRIVTNLRAQLRLADPAADLIRTRRGLGYELVF
jgi:DNA-binding response OmpR family regulator